MQKLEEILNNLTTHNVTNSLFISFEGMDGSGKSTQVQLTKSYFEKLNYKVLVLREPGGTKFGEKLREAILESSGPLNKISELLLFASSRSQLLYEKIIPFLNSQKHCVIVDRYIDSSIAYQGHAGKLGIETVLSIHQHFPLNLMPHLTILLNIDSETSLQRQNKRAESKDYFEKQNKEFYQDLYNGYQEAAKIFNNRIYKIDGNQSIEKIQLQIQKKIDEII